MEKFIKRYEWRIDEDLEEAGIKTISLVDEPAIESNFIAFSKAKPKYIKFEAKEYKQVVAGLAMIPEKDIYRVDENGNEYVGFFSAETIEEIRNKFHKEQQTNNMNTNHDAENYINAYLIESYIVNSEKQVEDLKDKGIEEAVIGAWFTAYKIEDKEVFEKVLKGEYNGFSIEIYADRILQSLNKNNVKQNKFSMKNLVEKLKKLVDQFEAEKINFIKAAIADLNVTIAQPDFEEWTVGEAIVSLVVSEDGTESEAAIADGDYKLDDGVVLVVKEGILSEVKQPEVEEEPVTVEEPMAVVEEVTAVEEEPAVVDGAGQKKLEELIDLTKNGYYTIEVYVENGAFTYGTIFSNTWKELEFKANESVEALKLEIEELKLKLKEPVANPKLGDVTINEKLDYSKMSAFERIARKNNLPIV